MLVDEVVDRFADEIGVSVVSGVFLDQVGEDPAEAWRVAIWPGATCDAPKSAAGERAFRGCAGALDRSRPQVPRAGIAVCPTTIAETGHGTSQS